MRNQSIRRFFLLTVCIIAVSGCDNMADQPKLESYERAEDLPNQMAAQHPPVHTLKFQAEAVPMVLSEGIENGSYVPKIPIPIDKTTILEGKQLYEAFCANCHGYAGYGDGMIVQRGFPPPPTFHSDRLRRAPAGYLYTVLKNGYGIMLPYGNRMTLKERWRIIAYIRTLQLSQHGTRENISDNRWDALTSSGGQAE